jgi:GTPase SAR1 family protein
VFTLANGESALKDLIDKLSDNTKDMNESQTRFHIIDNLLFNCLGWSKDEVEVEKSEDNKFTDYEFGIPRLAILEAKRENIYFTIPVTENKSVITDIRSIFRTSKPAEAAISQAQQYCSSRGVPIGIVSNGHQYLVFLASRLDGVSVFDGKIVAFRSLKHLLINFDVAWRLISSAGIKEKNVLGYLTSTQSAIPIKLSSKLINYPVARYISDTQASLRQLSELFLQDVVDNIKIESNFFAECYCDSGALSKYALLSKNILSARYASLFDKSESLPHISPVKEKKNDNFSPDILAESIAKRPIVLLGDVGVGKTSFVKNLIYNSAYKEFQNAIYIYIDLGSKAALSDSIKVFVLNEIERQLYDKYQIDTKDYHFLKGVYVSEMNRFSKGIWGRKAESDPLLYETKQLEELELLSKETDQHLKRCIGSYSKSSKRQIIISLDNADQRDFDVQQDAFIISQELAKDWNASVFVSVRPQTFFKSKRSGALTAYPHKIFTISPPRIELVIEKRLIFALKMAEGKIPLETLQFIRVNSENLAQFIKALLSSLLNNPDLLEFLTNITGGNIRTAIEFVTGFIGSPNVDSEKIIDIMNREGSYRIPLHEFTKSALLGDFSHYNPDTSMALNVFDVSTPDPKEHFLVSILLSYLISSNSIQDKDGFYTIEVIFEELQNLGFTSDQITFSLRRTTNKKLIETSQRVTFDEDENGTLIGEMPKSFRITTIGAYHLNRWIGVFTYFDAMVFDTPIFESDDRDKMMEHINSLTIAHRYERAEAFKSYLIRCWNSLDNTPTYFNFLQITRDNKFSFEKVKKVINNNSNH